MIRAERTIRTPKRKAPQVFTVKEPESDALPVATTEILTDTKIEDDATIDGEYEGDPPSQDNLEDFGDCGEDPYPNDVGEVYDLNDTANDSEIEGSTKKRRTNANADGLTFVKGPNEKGVWQYCVRDTTKLFAKCTYRNCGKLLSYKGSTSTLRNHLNRIHGMRLPSSRD